MDQTIIRELLIGRMRRQSETVEQASRQIARGLQMDIAYLAPAVDSIRREGRKNMLLDSPPGVFPQLADEARYAGWYTGAEDGDEYWPALRGRLETGGLREVVADIDGASTKVVSHFADPQIQGLKKRGLVVGYVQSGKTANYTAVMAKSADAGYRLFIVLAGMHNNLRRQTQVRLSRDLVDHSWAPLTTNDADFGNVINGAAMLGRGVHAIAVVKKNASRLRRLRDWLRDIPEDIRRRVPVLLLDDEADQATPNSAARADELTKINRLIREIWGEVKTGTYVGYTATPFANIFMDPSDEEELYPADFIIDLPRPEAYFGAERLFGREPLDNADDPEPGLDMVRNVPEDDAVMLKPPSGKAARTQFDPELPASLVDAVRWFLLATAIRRARGQHRNHSSMLIHTTHFVDPHFAMKKRLIDLLNRLKAEWPDDEAAFRAEYDDEAFRARDVASQPMPEWSAVAAEMERVLADVRPVVDNGFSDDRLYYERVDHDGNPVPETVVAIGGGTLSRGLTLEGLVVSYFTRTSNTYDTLLQMGRWFGFRPGYEDLTRIWMQESLAEEFKFLALVEEEIRQDMHHMERMKVTPRELGVRVRAHPGRLAIVARNKMQHADVVRISYSGQRLQTFIFDETREAVVRRNVDVGRAFIARCHEVSTFEKSKNAPRWVFSDVPNADVIDFLGQYSFHEDQVGLQADHVIGWLRRAAKESRWNVMVIGSDKKHVKNGRVVELGDLDLGLEMRIPAVNRAPLKEPEPGTANIKALLSHNDWFADLDPEFVRKLSKDERSDPRAVRRKHADGRGLLILYPISKDSTPLGVALGADSRRNMEAPDHLLGLGIIFPDVDREGVADEGTYYSVHPDWEVEAEEEDELPEDREGDASVDGARVGGGI